jgi:hypothetical protein
VSPTVDDLRNEIRRSTGRFEREASTAFTKESLAAIYGAVGYEIDGNRLPPTSEMRGAILRRVGVLDAEDPDPDRSFRKAELEAIAAALREE